MRDQLIGYLVGALEPEEERTVAARLAEDPDLRRSLDRLEASLAPLAADAGQLSPPAGLADRTCRRVLHRSILVADSPRTVRAGWSWSDLAVAAGIFIAASLLFFPAVNYSREEARLAYCQNNLKLVGSGLAQYSQAHAGYFPYVPPQGFAGWYAPALVHNGFLESSRVLLCPGSDLATEKDFFVPRVEDTLAPHRAPVTQLVRVRQQKMGGSYGYTLGYLDEGKYLPLRDQGRSGFPLMADVPNSDPGNLRSLNHAVGHNVLFEDGHAERWAQPVRMRTSGGLDPLFLNDTGDIAAGLSPDDAVIGASDAMPVPPKKAPGEFDAAPSTR